jgi:hypothetical protein
MELRRKQLEKLRVAEVHLIAEKQANRKDKNLRLKLVGMVVVKDKSLCTSGGGNRQGGNRQSKGKKGRRAVNFHRG